MGMTTDRKLAIIYAVMLSISVTAVALLLMFNTFPNIVRV